MLSAIDNLNHTAFQERQNAYDQLKKHGKLAEPLLKQQPEKTRTPETQRRIESLLNDIEGMQLPASERQALRAVEIVDRINTPPATALLARWAQGATGARLTELASECHQLRMK